MADPTIQLEHAADNAAWEQIEERSLPSALALTSDARKCLRAALRSNTHIRRRKAPLRARFRAVGRQERLSLIFLRAEVRRRSRRFRLVLMALRLKYGLPLALVVLLHGLFTLIRIVFVLAIVVAVVSGGLVLAQQVFGLLSRMLN